MHFLNKSFYYFIGISYLFLCLSACSQSDELLKEQLNMRILLNVQQEGMKDGRALIENTDALRDACTQEKGGEAIGIWSAFESNGVITEHVLGLNDDVSLIYSQGTTWYNWEGWTYGNVEAVWGVNLLYYFNAYFPKEGGLTGITNTKTAIQGNYNTETTQTDLMVKRVVVDTSADTFKGDPVPLPMKHALATVKFIFQMNGGIATELLKSFSLDNTLKTSASLNYNTESITIDNWTNRAMSANERIYEWSDDNGISFSTEEGAVPYTTGEGRYRTDDGHIFIIPQQCDVSPTFNCIIGTKPYQNIPLGTTKFEPGNNYIYTIKVKGETIDVTLSIKPWNEKNSSYDIDF